MNNVEQTFQHLVSQGLMFDFSNYKGVDVCKQVGTDFSMYASERAWSIIMCEVNQENLIEVVLRIARVITTIMLTLQLADVASMEAMDKFGYGILMVRLSDQKSAVRVRFKMMIDNEDPNPVPFIVFVDDHERDVFIALEQSNKAKESGMVN